LSAIQKESIPTWQHGLPTRDGAVLKLKGKSWQEIKKMRMCLFFQKKMKGAVLSSQPPGSGAWKSRPAASPTTS